MINPKRYEHVLMHWFDPSDPRGAVWARRDSCGGNAHFGVVVPTWWCNPEFDDEVRLHSYVDCPDSISGPIDE